MLLAGPFCMVLSGTVVLVLLFLRVNHPCDVPDRSPNPNPTLTRACRTWRVRCWATRTASGADPRDTARSTPRPGRPRWTCAARRRESTSASSRPGRQARPLQLARALHSRFWASKFKGSPKNGGWRDTGGVRMALSRPGHQARAALDLHAPRTGFRVQVFRASGRAHGAMSREPKCVLTSGARRTVNFGTWTPQRG